MPYIKEEDRTMFAGLLGDCGPISTAGDLNYVLTIICDEYLKNKGKCYQNINEVIGVMECMKQEFYRRVVAPYEDQKIKENGEVYYV